ncbi:MAG TPA: ATP synthase subunit I [Acidimicrobiales bacterium]|nr:ATP synthase subunit I [Acidimicrobiales bacterium]
MTERPGEMQVAGDMARKSVAVAAVLVVASSIAWGLDGALSSAYAVALVVLNLLAAAALIGWGAPRGGGFLMGAVLGGYLVRMAGLGVALFAVKDAAWIERAPLLVTLVVTHLGLLLWETRSVSLSLAYPGLKPARAHTSRAKKEIAAR